jgi:hypothetical protein
VECVARTSVIATSGGTGAFGFARRWRRVACGFTGCLRRRRLHKSVASANLTTSIEGVALATFTAWAAVLRSTAQPVWGHRRLTTHSSGRATRAAKFGR